MLNIVQISNDKKIQNAFVETSKRFIDRIADIIKMNNTLIPIEPLIYSPMEFEKMKREKREFIRIIEEEGIQIYDAGSTKMVKSGKE